MIHWRWLELKQESVAMIFGERLRELRKAKNLGQRALADMVDINFTYLSKIENGRLDFAQFPSEDLIRKLAKALDADEDELLLLAKKIPEGIKNRVLERPDAFRKIAALDDEALNAIVKQIEKKERGK
jgi:transcriptional regulator with XRE-family HTH domain